MKTDYTDQELGRILHVIHMTDEEFEARYLTSSPEEEPDHSKTGKSASPEGREKTKLNIPT